MGIPRGKDGDGQAETVDGIGPDSTGNIPLNAYTAANPPPAIIGVTWDAPDEYAFLRRTPVVDESYQIPGTNYAGSQLRPGGISESGTVMSISWDSPAPAGTWRLQGITAAYSTAGNLQTIPLYRRIDSPDNSPLILQLKDEDETIQNCQFSTEDNSTIDCDVSQKGVWLPFTASPTDCTAWGREIYANALAGVYGEVAAYVAPMDL